MILVVTTAEHPYTHSAVVEERDTADIRIVSWDEVLTSSPAPKATYILTDFDRLPDWKLRKAALFFRHLRREGHRVFNDPARVASRQGLLRRLHRAGINGFNAYRVEEVVQPARWPVFLRSDGNHGNMLTGLIHDWGALQEKIYECVRAGFPVASMLIVEYAAEPAAPGVFRKLSVFRVGPRLIGYTCVHDDQWMVKHGKKGIAPLDFYEEEFRFVRDNPYGETVLPAFVLGGVDYGRMDFGIVDGRPQIYEINTNPELKLVPEPSEIARRNESFVLFRSNYLAALKAIDTPG
jgi:hypothetical protein